MRLRPLIICVLLVLGGGGAALAASNGKTLHDVKTFTLQAGKTKKFLVPYPDALKVAGSTYSGKVQILAPTPGTPGTQPSLKLVHVKSKGSVLGGSDFSATVQNANKAGTASVRVRITATTHEPSGPGFY